MDDLLDFLAISTVIWWALGPVWVMLYNRFRRELSSDIMVGGIHESVGRGTRRLRVRQ
jgi:hypothetical protein